MKRLSRLSLIFLIVSLALSFYNFSNVEASPSYEDFTTYTEVDPNSDITITSSKCDVDTMERNVEAYVRDSKGVGHFGDFEHKVTIRIGTFGATLGSMAFWGVSNGSSTMQQMADADEGMGVSCWLTATPTYQLELKDYTNNNVDSYVATADTTYYLTIQRSGNALTCKIYSDSLRENLLDTLQITCGTGTYEYIFGVFSRNAATGTQEASGYTEDLDLQEEEVPELNFYGSINPQFTVSSIRNWAFNRYSLITLQFTVNHIKTFAFDIGSTITQVFTIASQRTWIFTLLSAISPTFTISSTAEFISGQILNFYGAISQLFSITSQRSWILTRFSVINPTFTIESITEFVLPILNFFGSIGQVFGIHGWTDLAPVVEYATKGFVLAAMLILAFIGLPIFAIILRSRLR